MSCGATSLDGKVSSSDASAMKFFVERVHTNQKANVLRLESPSGGDERFVFSILAPSVKTSVPQGTRLPLITQDVQLEYDEPGVYTAELRIERESGDPFILSVVSWEYQLTVPAAPVISFSRSATGTKSTNLLIATSRDSNIEAIWTIGDLDAEGKEVDRGGYWSALKFTGVTLPLKLSAGDGTKTVNAKFRDIFGNESPAGVPAKILLKQKGPETCNASLLASTVSSPRVKLRVTARDSGSTFFSVLGDVSKVVSQQVFNGTADAEIELPQTRGVKTLSVLIEDLAGTICFDKRLSVNVDPDYQAEVIEIDGHTFWTDVEDVFLTPRFDPNSAVAEIKITGDVIGESVNVWRPLENHIPIRLYPTTSGTRRVFVQSRNAEGRESPLRSKRIYLRPSVTVAVVGAMEVVRASRIEDADSVSITGCTQQYQNVDYQADFPCGRGGSLVTVTYNFPDGTQLSRSTTR